MTLVAVILAGGASKRFGSPKQAYHINGVPLLQRVIELARAVADEVVVSVSEHAKSVVEPLLPGGVELIVDANQPCQGPLRGLATVFTQVHADEYLVLPCDLAWARAETLKRLVEISRSLEAETLSPLSSPSLIQTLVAYTRRSVAGAAARACSILGPWGRPSELHRLAQRLVLLPPQALKADPLEFATLNRPEDLSSPPRPEAASYGLILQAHYRHHVEALENMSRSQPVEAAQSFVLEARVYQRVGLLHLYRQALADARRVAPIGMVKDSE